MKLTPYQQHKLNELQKTWAAMDGYTIPSNIDELNDDSDWFYDKTGELWVDCFLEQSDRAYEQDRDI